GRAVVAARADRGGDLAVRGPGGRGVRRGVGRTGGGDRVRRGRPGTRPHLVDRTDLEAVRGAVGQPAEAVAGGVARRRLDGAGAGDADLVGRDRTAVVRRGRPRDARRAVAPGRRRGSGRPGDVAGLARRRPRRPRPGVGVTVGRTDPEPELDAV